MIDQKLSILYVMASHSECGKCLQSKIDPFMIGIGPVEAGVNLTAELGRLSYNESLPDLVVSLGSAGSSTLPQKEVFQVTALSYRDMDVSLLGYEKGCNPLLDLPAVVVLPLQVPDIKGATLSTGGSIVSGAAYDQIDADMVDMETFAVWRACQKYAVPMIGLRGISDGKKELGGLSDWEKHLDVLDEKLCQALDKLEIAVQKGLLASQPWPKHSTDLVGRQGEPRVRRLSEGKRFPAAPRCDAAIKIEEA